MQCIKMKPAEKKIWAALAVILTMNIGFWFFGRHYQSRWINVPPAPDRLAAAGYGLGDLSFSYRAYGLLLQNLGDFGGRTTSFKEYNYEYLSQWFSLMSTLDPHSDYLPFMASYYFGGVDDPAKLKFIVDYLEQVGNSPEGDKWRWLAYAVYLARFKMNDLDRALELANKLGAIENPKVPQWARNMAANVLNDKGHKEAAYDLLVNILKDGADRMKPNEINATVGYICEQVLEPEQAKINSLCQGQN